MLPGHIGVLFVSKDLLEATKAVLKFSDDNDSCMQLLGAQMDGYLISKEDVQTLSKIPPKNELRAQFLGLLQAPMAETLGVMDALLASVLHCVNNKSKEA
jgi:large subunit ribosomal protein L10